MTMTDTLTGFLIFGTIIGVMVLLAMAGGSAFDEDIGEFEDDDEGDDEDYGGFV